MNKKVTIINNTELKQTIVFKVIQDVWDSFVLLGNSIGKRGYLTSCIIEVNNKPISKVAVWYRVNKQSISFTINDDGEWGDTWPEIIA